jgi:hypothetical protein
MCLVVIHIVYVIMIFTIINPQYLQTPFLEPSSKQENRFPNIDYTYYGNDGAHQYAQSPHRVPPSIATSTKIIDSTIGAQVS